MRIRSDDSTETQYLPVIANDRACTDISWDLWHTKVGRTRSMTDVVTQKYRQRSREGEVIVNPMTQVIEERQPCSGWSGIIQDTTLSGSCKYYEKWTDGSAILYGWGGAERKVKHLDYVTDRTSLHVEAATQARAGIADPTFAGATFVAEISDAVKLFTSPFGALKDFFKDVQRDRNRGLLARAKADSKLSVGSYISKHWLYYRYGIMPILYSIEDAGDALTTLEGWAKPRVVSRGTASDDHTVYKTQTGAGNPNWYVARDIETNHRYEVRCGVIYEVTEQNTFGASLQDVPAALWEIVPFSFVVDWLFNVNDYIKAITPKVGVKVLGEWTTVKHIRDTQADGYSTGRKHGASITYLADPTSSESLRTETKQRVPVMARSGVTWSPTDFIGSVVGRKRVLDTIALALSFLNK